MFKIFYSWQSDLTPNDNRNFIRKCIDEGIRIAKDAEAIDAVRDEATTGATGSPDIVSTLFSKIDECDFVVADVSLCYTSDQGAKKRSPNPNVMLELGYAVKTLGWDRIFCICNKDYGDNIPFDLAHHRITFYSLKGSDGDRKRNEEGDKRRIGKLMASDISKLKERQRAKDDGFANFIVGTYNAKTHEIDSLLKWRDIKKASRFNRHNDQLLEEIKIIFKDIADITARMREGFKNNGKIGQFDQTKNEKSSFGKSVETVVSLNAENYFENKKIKAVWEDGDSDRALIEKYLNEKVPEDFFDLGGLLQSKNIFPLYDDISYYGTDDEKEKHEKLEELSYMLNQYDIRNKYPNTFRGMYYLPLAIKNISPVYDEQIRICVSVKVGNPVDPSMDLIDDELEGLQEFICRDDDSGDELIGELFALEEDGIICMEEIARIPRRVYTGLPVPSMNGLVYPSKTKEDYEMELQEYIAHPDSHGNYEFNISSLRPGECKWLGCGMLIEPANGIVTLHYHINSKRTDGSLSGNPSTNLDDCG